MAEGHKLILESYKNWPSGHKKKKKDKKNAYRSCRKYRKRKNHAYKDARWSFNLEVYFLTQRFKDILEIANSKETIIQDRTILEGVHIFVANNYEMGNLSGRDYQTYMDLFRLMMSLVKTPDLLIYLKSSIPHLVSQIQKRGRDCEKSISIEYLNGLNEKYEKWITGYEGQVLAIDADHLDFENRPEDFALITDQIDATLYGLFSTPQK